MEFHGLGARRVVGRFDGGRISSDGGSVLLREVEKRTHILKRLAGCFIDHRDPELIEHSVESLIKQRVVGMALNWPASPGARRPASAGVPTWSR
ncbi:MAG: transposase [Chromatiales bacterium]